MVVESGGNGNPPKKSDPKEEKVRATRERQAEERLRRLEELKKHALEAQQIREQKETDRRRRMDELRIKENERRALVETRKKEIWEAERDRRESILRKNQERDARMDAKRRNERSSMVFAFGSSTPRLLETSDSVVSSYWGPRRATSTANLRLFPANASMTESVIDGSSSVNPRRPSEREQEPKKRAASAGGLYRSPSDKMTSSMYEVFHWEAPNNLVNSPLASTADADDNWNVPRVGRRKTDLIPTTPSPRDPTSRPGSGSRSLARTPGDVTPSRPGSVMSQSSILSSSLSRPRTTPRKPRPSSIHVTGVSKDKILSPSDEKPKIKEMKLNKPPPPPKPTVTKKQIQQKNEEIKKSQQKTVESDDNKKSIETVETSLKTVAVKKDIVKVVSEETATAVEKVNGTTEKEGVAAEEMVVQPNELIENSVENSAGATGPNDSGVSLLVDFSSPMPSLVLPSAATSEPPPVPLVDVAIEPLPPVATATIPTQVRIPTPEPAPVSAVPSVAVGDVLMQVFGAETDATVKAPKPLANTEEEARAKLAERRRLAREQAEREAEAERQRLAKEAAEEEERIRQEEEEQRKFEEEQLRLLEEARRVEEQRLMLAIQEAQRKEEEEKERKRQEEVARLEKEEADRLSREEVERQRLEMAERLKKEEEERQARRKRVEAIMKRTRNVAPNSATKAECEKGEQDGAEREKDDSKGNLEAFLHGERLSADRSLTNGQGSPSEPLPTKMESSHSNGISSSEIPNEDCVNSNSSLDTPLIAFQGSKDTPLPPDFLA